MDIKFFLILKKEGVCKEFLRGARRKYVNLRRKKQEKNLEIFSILE
jgi:hypothetical protein